MLSTRFTYLLLCHSSEAVLMKVEVGRPGFPSLISLWFEWT